MRASSMVLLPSSVPSTSPGAGPSPPCTSDVGSGGAVVVSLTGCPVAIGVPTRLTGIRGDAGPEPGGDARVGRCVHHPGVLAAAALGRVHHQGPLAPGHPREAAPRHVRP